MESHADIRTKLQQQRQALSKEQQTARSEKICQQIMKNSALESAKHIAIYLPVRGEADPTPLMQQAENQDKQFYLPLLSTLKPNHLSFAPYNQETNMTLNRFSIPEPDVADDQLIHDPQQLDIIITPLVGVDTQGNRIGMGGGFYDRTFAFRKANKQPPWLVAFAYDFQLVNIQMPQDWDVPVDMISLENQFIRA